MNTDELAALEERWLNKQRSLAGDRDGLYEQTGVYEAWREIFRNYVTLAKQGDLEALKRAVYFAWAQCSISRLTTGIKDLDAQAIREAFGVADERAQEGRLDAELQWMLPYYYVVERSYLDGFEDLEALRQASGLHPFLYRQRCLDASFAQRGQMGDYWRAEQALLRRWPSVDTTRPFQYLARSVPAGKVGPGRRLLRRQPRLPLRPFGPDPADRHEDGNDTK